MSQAESFPYLPRPSSFHLSSAFNAAAEHSSDSNHPNPDYALGHSFIYDSGSDTHACNQRDPFLNLKPMPEPYNQVQCGDSFALV